MRQSRELFLVPFTFTALPAQRWRGGVFGMRLAIPSGRIARAAVVTCNGCTLAPAGGERTAQVRSSGSSQNRRDPNKINVVKGKFLLFAFLSPRLYCKKILSYHTFKNTYILLQI